VDALAAELAARVSASEVSMLIADISGRTLARLARRPAPGWFLPLRPAREHVEIDGTPAGTALTTQRIHVSRDEDGLWVHIPVSERGEAIGVLELLLPEEPDAQILNYLRSAGHALAYVIIADRRFSDLYELGQRSTMLTLEAEIQRRLLPASYACEGPQFALAGWLVPADEAGGDTFDYMVDRDALHLSITDAMGHGVPAAQLATLGLGSLRNSRRRGLGLTDQARQASTHIAKRADADQFVTALLGRIDLQTGAVEMVNAGHMNPLVVRDGQVSEIALDAGLCWGSRSTRRTTSSDSSSSPGTGSPWSPTGCSSAPQRKPRSRSSWARSGTCTPARLFRSSPGPFCVSLPAPSGTTPPSSLLTGTATPAPYPHSCRQRTGHLDDETP